MENGKRELGTINSVNVGPEDHGIDTCWVMIDFGGGCQGFGGLCLNELKLQKSFVKDLCEAFGVSKVKDLVGKKCYALRCWGHWNDRIEGLESVDTGSRFTISGWRKKLGYKFSSPLDERKNSIHNDISRLNTKIFDLQMELSKLNNDYTDWDNDNFKNDK